MKEKQIAISGPSKSGKTRKILFPEVKEKIKEGKSLFIVDSKEEYYPYFREELIKNNYQVKILNFIEPLNSDGWDPLAYPYFLYQQNQIDKAIELIKDFSHILFESDRPRDPFWENCASDYLTGIILVLFKLGNKETVHFSSLINLINDGEKPYQNSTYLKTYISQLDPMDPAYIAVSTTLFSPTETKESILSVVKQQLNSYFLRPNLLQSFQYGKINLSESSKEKTAYFLISYSPLERLSTAFIQQLYKAVEKDDLNYSFILEDIDSMREIPDMKAMLYSSTYKKLQLYGTSKQNSSFPYRPHTFEGVEKKISLTTTYEEVETEPKSVVYPTLETGPLHIFTFQDYYKK